MIADPCLQLDVGNSALKWRLLHRGKPVARGLVSEGDLRSRVASIDADSVTSICVASVAADAANDELAEFLQDRWHTVPWFAATAARTGDLINSYAEPERMGVDRWLAMLGARERCKDRLCVVDAGSALTIDLVAADGVHEGGYILPGVALMARSLLQNTDRVRYPALRELQLNPGQDTASAVSHGIALALSGAVESALRHSERSGPPPKLFITGGAGRAIQDLLQVDVLFVEDLVFEGLQTAFEAR